jgi:hypothetical protein
MTDGTVLLVYCNDTIVGGVVPRVRGYVAKDRAGRKLGTFSDQLDAAAAIIAKQLAPKLLPLAGGGAREG